MLSLPEHWLVYNSVQNITLAKENWLNKTGNTFSVGKPAVKNLHVYTRNKIDSSLFMPDDARSGWNACLKMHRKPPYVSLEFLRTSNEPVSFTETVKRNARVYCNFITEQINEIS